MIEYPKISIVTVTFNSENTLEETIKSIESQRYDNLEYIIIDGGSKDGTLSIVDKYSSLIYKVVSEKDSGISDAFNKGIKLSTGEIIGIINSDDVLLPGALDALAEAYDPEIDVYRGNTMAWDDRTGSRTRMIPAMELNLSKPVWNVCHPSTFVSKRCYNRFGLYNVSFRYMMDADILYRFYFGGAKFKYVDYDMTLFRLGGVTGSSYSKKIPELRAVVILNGGSGFMAFSKAMKFRLYNIAKKIVFYLLGGERARKLHYR